MKFVRYSLLLLLFIGLDRITKVWALIFLHDREFFLFPWLNFSLVWNRGVSWGLFHDVPPFGFLVLTSVIIFVIFALAFYTFYVQLYRFRADITGELMVFAGALSNVFDRLSYGGVIDFVQVHAGAWYFPTFNIADMFVVIGIVWLFFKNVVVTHDDQDKGNVL